MIRCRGLIATGLILTLASGWAGLAAQTEGGAVLRVRITDSALHPIPFPSLAVSGRAELYSPAADGWVAPIRLSAGDYLLTVRAIGFLPDTIRVTLANGESRTVSVALNRVVYRLRDLVTRAQPWAPSLEDYARRVRVYGGRLITRQAIERGGYFQTIDLLGTVIGMRIDHVPPTVNLQAGLIQGGSTVVRSVGCGGRGSVYLDGREIMGSPVPLSQLADRLDIVRPWEIELIEVYRRHEEIPAVYRDPEACMALMIWTKAYIRSIRSRP